MRTRLAAILVATALVVAACGGSDSATDTDSVNDEPVTLTLLAHESFTPSEGIFDEFTAAKGISVEILRSADAGTLVTKAALTAGSPEGDVLWGVDNTLLSRALEADVFEPYRSANADFLDADAMALVPNDEVTPVDTGDVCINYDKAWYAERNVAPPTSLDDLLDERYRSHLVVPNPLTSSPGLAFLLATIAKYGDDGWTAWWEMLRANDVLIVESWSDAYYGPFSGSSGAGDRPLVVSYASSPPAEVIFADPPRDDAPTAVVVDTCFRQVEFAGVLRGTQHPEQAKRLVDFLTSTTFQNDLPLTQFVYPVHRDAVLPDVFVRHSVRPDAPLTLDPARIAADRTRWLDTFSSVMLR
jgi:thiamine transport system substrate-binding protein